MTNPATEAFERLFAELARKWDQTQDPGDLMQILSLINSRFSALELVSQPSATRLPEVKEPPMRLEGVDYQPSAAAEPDHIGDANKMIQPAAAGQAEPCAHRVPLSIIDPYGDTVVTGKLTGSCTRCGEPLILRWVPAQAEGKS